MSTNGESTSVGIQNFIRNTLVGIVAEMAQTFAYKSQMSCSFEVDADPVIGHRAQV